MVATPSDWSARIGIFGKWGDGKSTVLRFVENMLKEKGSIVFTFNPWAIQDWNDLWEDFGGRLLDALSVAKIPFDGSWKKTAKSSARWLESTGLGKAGEAMAGLFGRDKVYSAAFGALSRWLRYDGVQIRSIRQKLHDRRLVVLIDDLDRCAPDLIPQLLLSLRELLDLPGFTFILAFDDEIVGQALTEKNPAWGNGSDFLEKILDFRFHLPPITERQKERFISRAMTRYCAFVPVESVKIVQDLLPNNPRRLKALIRSLVALRPQIARHDADELNWVDMWIAQLLRHESHPFLERLLLDDDLDREIGPLYQVAKITRNTSGTEKGEENERLTCLIGEAGVEDATVKRRLIRLVEAARARASSQFRYMCELATRPCAVTWKEFRSLYTTWIADRRDSVLTQWIGKHAMERAVSVDELEEELFEAMIVKRNRVLSSAAESHSTQEHELYSEEAEILLGMIDQFLFGRLTAPRFRKMYGQASYWMGFRRNGSDQVLRDQEATLILKQLSAASNSLATELFEVLPQGWHLDLGDTKDVIDLRRTLQERCLAILSPKTSREALAFFTREGGIQSLVEGGRHSAIRYCLFNRKSPMWKNDLRDQLLSMVRKGQQEITIYNNCRAFFNLLVQGLRNEGPIGREEIINILLDEKFVQELWATVSSRGFQYRMRMLIVQSRQALIDGGVSEKLLPLNEELRLRQLEELSS